MDTNRFETFYDAVLAIVITILVLKIPQPLSADWGAFFSNYANFITYFIVFLAIINIWYSNQKLFQHIDDINNRALITYGISIFLFSLFPYFASWLSMNLYSLTAEIIFGLIIIFGNLSHILSVVVVYGTNVSNDKLKELNIKKIHLLIPFLIIVAGFIISFTIFTPGIYLASLFSVIVSIIYNKRDKKEYDDTERFEALIDAILAIIITIIVLEIPLASTGSWESLFELRYEFLIYAISFIVCFNFWNFNNNLFSIVNKIDAKVIWTMGVTLFVFSLLPYLTTFVAENINVFFPQFLYGLSYIATAILSKLISKFLRESDPGNIALQLALEKDYIFAITIVLVIIGMIIGYLVYPPVIIICCLLSIIAIWIIPHIKR